MADKRISQLVERTDIANNDVLPIVASGATTTNKVTISTIQDWMQDNLDVGVTSVGLTLGTTGTDVNVTGSPITTSGNITINIPDASASNRGVVTTGSQVFGGVKTFANGFILPSAGGSNQASRFVNIGTIHEGSAGSNQIGFNNSNNIYFGKGLSNGGVIQWTNAAVRYYTLPDADGTIALTSQLDGYVTIGTAQTITAQKTFTTSGSSDTMIISHGSGSGIALDVIKAGNGEAIRIQKTSGSGNAVTITGGTLSAEAGQFSGDVQTATRFAASSGSNGITITPNVGGTQNRIETTGSLPLSLVSAAAITMAAGGTTPQITLATTGAVTLTGALNGTSASFSGNVGIGISPSAPLHVVNASNGFIQRFAGGTSSAITGGIFAEVGRNFASIGTISNHGFHIFTNDNDALSIASTGAATFSSSVTVGGGVGHKIELKDGAAWPSIRRNTSTGGIIFDTEGSSIAGSILSVKTLNGSDFVTVQSSGSVGIGTTSPDGNSKLDVNGQAFVAHLALYNNNGTPSLGTSPILYSPASGTLAISTASTERMRITSGGYLKASNTGSYMSATSQIHEIRSSANDDWTANISHSATSSPYGISIRFTGSSPNGSLNYFLECIDSTTSRLRIASNGNVTNVNGSYGSISDAKLKENIEDATPKLHDLLKVKVRNYNLIGEETKQIGVIAQELEEVFPAMIDESEDFEEVEVPQLDEEGNEVLNEEGEVVTATQRVSKGTTTKSVKYSVFVPMLIKAIQELKTEIDSLKNQIK